jgi:hypothetical protein
MKLIGKTALIVMGIGLLTAVARADDILDGTAGQLENGAEQTEGWWDPGDWGRTASDGLKHIRDVVGDTAASLDPVAGARAFSDKQAAEYHDSHGNNGSFGDCIVIVAAACAGAASAVGAGPWGTALGGGAGAALADLSCRAWYP